MYSLGFLVLSISSSARGGPWLYLRSSPEWVARCWGGLLLAGRNVRVSMMVEGFGIYMFFERFLVLGICVLVLTCVLVLVCSVLLPCFPGGVLVVIRLWLVCCTTFIISA